MAKKKGKERASLATPAVLPENEKMRFSFQYYDGTKYCLSTWGEHISGALQKLKEICGMSFKEMSAKRWVLHFHEVDWKTTAEKRGFPIAEVNSLTPFQFALVGVNNQKARVFGAYSLGTFYVVWFDLNHQVDPSPLKNT